MRLALLLAMAFAASASADELYPVYETPLGTCRLETLGADKPEVIVSTKGAAQHQPLPGATIEDPEECTIAYGGSPDEKWIYRTESWRHHAVQGRQLYLHKEGAAFAPFKGKDWFAQTGQAFIVKNSAFKKRDFYEQRGAKVFEDHFGADFRGWSRDSSRLLVSVTGRERDDAPKRCYMYFNTRAKAFELTPYLCALNKRCATDEKETEMPCPEPVDALPPLEKLQASYEQLDKDLAKRYGDCVANAKRQSAEDWKDAQRQSREARNAGLEVYLQFAPPKEREVRRLQFLADTTAVEFETMRCALP